MADLVSAARDLMHKQTFKNKAPAWLLTEIAIEKGKQLSKKYGVNEKIVLTTLYLAHTVFDGVKHSKIRRQHPTLSANFVKKYLAGWKVPKKEQAIIINAIEAHHGGVPAKSKEAEVMKNAECFKFVTLRGCLILLHDLGARGWPFDESVKYVLYKMNQKRKTLTLEDCKREAEVNCAEIEKVFGTTPSKARRGN